MIRKVLAVLGLFVMGLAAGCQCFKIIPIDYAHRAKRQIPGDVKRIAVLDFKNDSKSPDADTLAKEIPDIIRGELSKMGRYELLERQKIKKVFEEKSFAGPTLESTASQQQTAEILQADALVLGDVTGIDYTARTVQTTIEEYDAETDQMVKRPVTYTIVDASLRFKAKMVDLKGNIIAEEPIEERRHYDPSKRQGGKWWQAFLRPNPDLASARIPPKPNVYGDMAKSGAVRFFRQISPHVVTRNVPIICTGDATVDLGVKLAEEGGRSRNPNRLKEAIDTFKRAMAGPYEKKDEIHYNIGVCFEALKDYKQAIAAYASARRTRPGFELYLRAQTRVENYVRDEAGKKKRDESDS